MIFQAGSLLLVIIGAYALKHVHIFGERDYRVVQGLVFNLTLPCAIILSFATNKHDMRMLWIVLFGFFACAVPLFIVYIGSILVLSDVSADFESGKMYAITGPSGAGKSTLLALSLIHI